MFTHGICLGVENLSHFEWNIWAPSTDFEDPSKALDIWVWPTLHHAAWILLPVFLVPVGGLAANYDRDLRQKGKKKTLSPLKLQLDFVDFSLDLVGLSNKTIAFFFLRCRPFFSKKLFFWLQVFLDFGWFEVKDASPTVSAVLQGSPSTWFKVRLLKNPSFSPKKGPTVAIAE